MSEHKQFRSPSVAALVEAVAASLQGLDRLPPEDRTSQSALRLLDYVVRTAFENNPDLRPDDERDLKTIVESLRASTEGRQKWAGHGFPRNLIH